MNKFNINIDGDDFTNTENNELSNFDTFGEVEDFESEDLDENLNDISSPISADKQCIEIEIVGLKSLTSFIGLEDTPVYYENGRFFKVENNKIVYTDINWIDIKGNIRDNKSAVEEIEKQIKESTGIIIRNSIDAHNNDINSHPYIQNIIDENYQNLNNKIDLNKYNTDEEIKTINEHLNVNDKNIEDLQSFTNDIRSDLDSLTVEVEVDIKNSITQLDEKVDGINANLTQQIDELEQDVNDKYNELIRDIDDLTDVVEEDYTTLNTKIDTTAQTINTRITNVADELNQTIEENVTALQQEDTALQNQINTHSQTLTAHDTRITNNTNAITKEIGDRQSADENLQEQIDGITAGADVRDIVGTYAQLQAYDKSKLGNNDIIKVLNDETKENASTYYRFSTSAQDFTYIGKEGPFYTKSETDGLLNEKQDTISDLEQIRTNAQAGANLVPQVGTNTTDIGDLKLNKANKDELPTKLSDLQDDITNTLGSELNYENSTLELLNSTGETLSSVTIKSTPDLDNNTISLNSDDQLQSVGSILQSGGYQKYWQGTKAEYEAIQVKDPDTLYEVLDDIVDIVTEIPTATVDDIGLCKPDGSTITIDDTGTLSIPSTFLLNHNSSNLAHVDVFNTKANVNLNNVNSAYDFAIYSVTYGGGESGYIKYRNRRLEMWGVTNASANGESEITMHLPFKDQNFSVFIEPREQGDFFHYAIPSGNQKFRVRIKGANGNFYGARFSWRAYGYYE